MLGRFWIVLGSELVGMVGTACAGCVALLARAFIVRGDRPYAIMSIRISGQDTLGPLDE